MSVTNPPPNALGIALSAEDRLMLACARAELGPADAAELNAALSAPIDWAIVVERSGWHKLDGLMYVHLRGDRYSGRVPADVMRTLRERHRSTVVRRMYFRQELTNILRALREHEIPVIVLKGAALAELVYSDPGARPMADLDILVPDAVAEQAQAIVQRMGYVPYGSPEDQEDTSANHRHLPVLVGVEKPTVVEVHRHVVRLDSPLNFDISGFWDRARDRSIAGVRVQVLGQEDQLIHLCVNFFMDRRFRAGSALGQLVDVAEVARGAMGAQDWNLLGRLTEGYGLRGPVGIALVLSRELVGAPVPDEVVGRLWGRSPGDAGLARFAMKRVLSFEPFVARELISPDRSYTPWNLGWSMFRRLVPTREYMVSRYGDSARGARGLRMYAVRLGEGVRMLIRGEARPAALREDLAVDRWIHSLYGR